MPTYETLFITPPTLSEDEEAAVVDGLAKIVTDGGGEFTVNERMGRRRLAYPIRKFEDGVYVRFLYDSESAVPQELERRIRLSDRVLRSLTVKLEEDWAVESKEQAKRDAQRRIEDEARRKAEEEARLAAEAEAAAKAEAAGEAAGEAGGEAAGAESATTGETADSGGEDAEVAKNDAPSEGGE